MCKSGFIRKFEENKTLEAKIDILDYESSSSSIHEYAEPYYDIKRQMIISPNNKRLKSSNYSDFIPLYADDTIYTLKLRIRRNIKNDIQTN